jgi:large subunit ribosomal protein L18
MDKRQQRIRRKKGIRKKIYGTAEKPRISVFRSNKNLYVQAIDDTTGRTMGSSSDVKGLKKEGANTTREMALAIGEALARDLKEKKIERAVFDRNGYLYHGVVRSLAEGIRKGGIQV